MEIKVWQDGIGRVVFLHPMDVRVRKETILNDGALARFAVYLVKEGGKKLALGEVVSSILTENNATGIRCECFTPHNCYEKVNDKQFHKRKGSITIIFF